MVKVTVWKGPYDWYADDPDDSIVEYCTYDNRSALQVVLDAINCGETLQEVAAADRWMSVSWVSGGKVKVVCNDMGYMEFDPTK